MLFSVPRWFLAGMLGAALLACFGCTGQMSPKKIATAGEALNSAKIQVEAGEFDAAVKNFDVALEGGLSVDQYVEALLGRALARANTGNVEGALQDLNTAQQGAPNIEDVHALRGYVLQKKGDAAGAQKEFMTARQINPRVKIPGMQ